MHENVPHLVEETYRNKQNKKKLVEDKYRNNQNKDKTTKLLEKRHIDTLSPITIPTHVLGDQLDNIVFTACPLHVESYCITFKTDSTSEEICIGNDVVQCNKPQKVSASKFPQ